MKRYLQTFLLIGLCLVSSYSFCQHNADTAKNNKEALAALNGDIGAIKEHDISKALSYYCNSKDFLVAFNICLLQVQDLCNFQDVNLTTLLWK